LQLKLYEASFEELNLKEIKSRQIGHIDYNILAALCSENT